MSNTPILWFKRKRYGWGWTPATWQGWLSTLIYIVLVIAFAQDIEPTSTADEVLSSLLGPILFLTVVFIWLAYKKGEKPRWQWGDDK